MTTNPTRDRERYAYHKHYAYAQVTDAEYAVLKAQARNVGLSISDFVRRCVNNYLMEVGDDVPLLAEQAEARGGRRRKPGPESTS